MVYRSYIARRDLAAEQPRHTRNKISPRRVHDWQVGANGALLLIFPHLYQLDIVSPGELHRTFDPYLFSFLLDARRRRE